MPEGSKYRDYRGVDGAVDDAVKGTKDATEKAESANAPVRRSNAVTARQAMRTERKPAPDEGARAFGAPMKTGARERQSTDSSQ